MSINAHRLGLQLCSADTWDVPETKGVRSCSIEAPQCRIVGSDLRDVTSFLVKDFGYDVVVKFLDICDGRPGDTGMVGPRANS